MIKHAVIPARLKISYADITGSYTLLGTFDDDLRLLMGFNSCNKPIIISLDNGLTDHFELEGEGFVIDFRSVSLCLEKPTIVVKHAGVAPTEGSFRVTGMK